jgi:hypothetical protein
LAVFLTDRDVEKPKKLAIGMFVVASIALTSCKVTIEPDKKYLAHLVMVLPLKEC